MKDWQCASCKNQMDGYLNSKPDVCVCGSTDFEPAAEAEKREADNRAINAQDDYREELSNE